MLEAVSKLYQHPRAGTMYLTIPSKIACDSQFPFKAGMAVEFLLLPNKLLIRRKQK